MSRDRPRRVESLLREIISDLFVQRKIRDPRLHGLITVTEVEVSKDLRHAKVFVSHLGTPEEEKGVFEALEGASGFVQSHIAREAGLRYTPRVRFVADHSIEHGVRLVNTINRLAAGAPDAKDTPATPESDG